MVGTSIFGTCGQDAVSLPGAPSTEIVAGLPCQYLYSQIAPDGNLFYLELGTGARVWMMSSDAWREVDGLLRYDDPAANDVAVPTPECTSVNAFFIEPDTGDILYQCDGTCFGEGCPIHRASGGMYDFPLRARYVVPGYDAHTLVGGVTGSYDLAVSRGAEDVRAVSDGPSFASFDGIRTQRARPGGFSLVTRNAAAPELWHVDFDGSATLVGTYPEVPESFEIVAFGYDLCRLDAADRMYCVATDFSTPAEVVLEFVVGAPEAAIVHDTSEVPAPLLTPIGVIGTFARP